MAKLFASFDAARAAQARALLLEQGALAPVLDSMEWQLDLDALLPFARWPVSHGLVQAQDFDFQRLNPAWPSTMITGQVDMLPRAALPGATVESCLPASSSGISG